MKVDAVRKVSCRHFCPLIDYHAELRLMEYGLRDTKMRTFAQTVIFRLKAILMTDRQLEQVRTFTDKEIMSNAIATLRGLTLNELLKTTNDKERKALEERQLLLEYEKMAVLGDDEIAKSIQDKVTRLYAPLLKAKYGQR